MLSDRFYRGPVGRGFIEGNPDLKPETSLQFDLTARYVAGPIPARRRRLPLPHHRSRRALRRDADAVSLPESRPRGTAGRGGRSAGDAAARLRPGGDGGNVARPRRRGWHAARRRRAGGCLGDAATRPRRTRGRRTFVSRRSASHDAAGPSEVPTTALHDASTPASAGVSSSTWNSRRDAQPPERGLSVERRPALGLGARTARVGDDRRGVLVS